MEKALLGVSLQFSYFLGKSDRWGRFASFFWPRQGVNYSKLMEIHGKMVVCIEVVFFQSTADRWLQNESAPTTNKAKAKPKRKTEDDPSKPKKKPKLSDSQKEVKAEGSSGEQL